MAHILDWIRQEALEHGYYEVYAGKYDSHLGCHVLTFTLSAALAELMKLQAEGHDYCGIRWHAPGA